MLLSEQVKRLTGIIQAGCSGLDSIAAEEVRAAVRQLIDLGQSSGAEAFSLIGVKLDDLLSRYRDNADALRSIDREVVALACGWLLHLARLYRECLPQPKALVNDLVATFVLVEHASGAGSLAQLTRSQGTLAGAQESDLFADDPHVGIELDSSLISDPFEDDLGFGVEPELMQQLMQQVLQREARAPEDPFADDPVPMFEAESALASGELVPELLPFDVFAEDPHIEQ
jgi:hypothetical protein